MAQDNVKDSNEKLELPLSQLQDSDNVCYQDAVASQTNSETSADTLIDLSQCESTFTTQDRMDFRDTMLESFEKFFIRHNIETPEGFISIVHSMTYGEMLISLLLFAILIVLLIKWFWEVVRY